MNQFEIKNKLTDDFFDQIFPLEKSDQFFEALYGDADEGAYNISIHFVKADLKKLELAFHLQVKPDKCLACNLTYGLPNVFLRHPIINIKQIVESIDHRINGHAKIKGWQLGNTSEYSADLHLIPLYLELE